MPVLSIVTSKLAARCDSSLVGSYILLWTVAASGDAAGGGQRMWCGKEGGVRLGMGRRTHVRSADFEADP